jgi:nitrogen fixation protein NifU and related proteins
MDDSMYREQIIDLYENPLNQGTLDAADISYEEDNPLCGDVIRIDIRLDERQRIADIKWAGQGCAISQAAASLLTEEVKGMSLDEVKNYTKEELLELLGISLSMQRLKCALLSFKVLKAGAYGVPAPDDLRGQAAHGRGNE